MIKENNQVKPKKKIKKKVDNVIAHVRSTFNNTLVSITDMMGNVIVRGSAGQAGFSGTKKSSPFAATQVAMNVGRELKVVGVKNVEVNMCGAGSGKDAFVRGLQSSGLNISMLRDVTPIAHNGGRARKRRRS